MHKNGLILLALVFWCGQSESKPTGLRLSEFDDLDTDIADLKYEVEEEDLDDFSKLLDETDRTSAAAKDIKTSGFKKKSASNKGSKKKYNIGDLKKFFNIRGANDKGSFDDGEVYAIAEGVVGNSVGLKGKEDRKYRKGTKTRGFHKVHHKDEYKKNKIFYEDDETSGKINKVGAKVYGVKLSGGAGFDKGRFHHNRRKGVVGKRGYADKGFSDKEFSDFSDSQGFDASFSNEDDY